MRCKNDRRGWFEAMMGAKGFQREKEGFRVHLLSQLSYRKTGDRGLAERSTWDRKTGRKHRQAHDEGAVLLLTLTSHKALKDFFFLLLFQVSEQSEEFQTCHTGVCIQETMCD